MNEAAISSHIDFGLDNEYGLLTKREVKIAVYWPNSSVHKAVKK